MPQPTPESIQAYNDWQAGKITVEEYRARRDAAAPPEGGVNAAALPAVLPTPTPGNQTSRPPFDRQVSSVISQSRDRDQSIIDAALAQSSASAQPSAKTVPRFIDQFGAHPVHEVPTAAEAALQALAPHVVRNVIPVSNNLVGSGSLDLPAAPRSVLPEGMDALDHVAALFEHPFEPAPMKTGAVLDIASDIASDALSPANYLARETIRAGAGVEVEDWSQYGMRMLNTGLALASEAVTRTGAAEVSALSHITRPVAEAVGGEAKKLQDVQDQWVRVLEDPTARGVPDFVGPERRELAETSTLQAAENFLFTVAAKGSAGKSTMTDLGEGATALMQTPEAEAALPDWVQASAPYFATAAGFGLDLLTPDPLLAAPGMLRQAKAGAKGAVIASEMAHASAGVSVFDAFASGLLRRRGDIASAVRNGVRAAADFQGGLREWVSGLATWYRTRLDEELVAATGQRLDQAILDHEEVFAPTPRQPTTPTLRPEPPVPRKVSPTLRPGPEDMVPRTPAEEHRRFMDEIVGIVRKGETTDAERFAPERAPTVRDVPVPTAEDAPTLHNVPRPPPPVHPEVPRPPPPAPHPAEPRPRAPQGGRPLYEPPKAPSTPIPPPEVVRPPPEVEPPSGVTSPASLDVWAKKQLIEAHGTAIPMKGLKPHGLYELPLYQRRWGPAVVDEAKYRVVSALDNGASYTSDAMTLEDAAAHLGQRADAGEDIVWDGLRRVGGYRKLGKAGQPRGSGSLLAADRLWSSPEEKAVLDAFERAPASRAAEGKKAVDAALRQEPEPHMPGRPKPQPAGQGRPPPKSRPGRQSVAEARADMDAGMEALKQAGIKDKRKAEQIYRNWASERKDLAPGFGPADPIERKAIEDGPVAFLEFTRSRNTGFLSNDEGSVDIMRVPGIVLDLAGRAVKKAFGIAAPARQGFAKTDAAERIAQAASRIALGDFAHYGGDAMYVGWRMVPKNEGKAVLREVYGALGEAGVALGDLRKRATGPMGLLAAQDRATLQTLARSKGLTWDGRTLYDVTRLVNDLALPRVEALGLALNRVDQFTGLAKQAFRVSGAVGDGFRRTIGNAIGVDPLRALNVANLTRDERVSVSTLAAGLRNAKANTVSLIAETARQEGTTFSGAAAHLVDAIIGSSPEELAKAEAILADAGADPKAIRSALRHVRKMDGFLVDGVLAVSGGGGKEKEAAIEAVRRAYRTDRSSAISAVRSLAQEGLGGADFRLFAQHVAGPDRVLADADSAAAAFIAGRLQDRVLESVATDLVRIGLGAEKENTKVVDYLVNLFEGKPNPASPEADAAARIFQNVGAPVYDQGGADLLNVRTSSAITEVFKRAKADGLLRAATGTDVAKALKAAPKQALHYWKVLLLTGGMPVFGGAGAALANYLGSAGLEMLTRGTVSAVRPRSWDLAGAVIAARHGALPELTGTVAGGWDIREVLGAAQAHGFGQASTPIRGQDVFQQLGFGQSGVMGWAGQQFAKGVDFLSMREWGAQLEITRRFDVMQRALAEGKGLDEAAVEGIEALGDLGGIPPTERAVMEAFIPFYAYRRWEFLNGIEAILEKPERMAKPWKWLGRYNILTGMDPDAWGSGETNNDDNRVILWHGGLPAKDAGDPRYSGYVVTTGSAVPSESFSAGNMAMAVAGAAISFLEHGYGLVPEGTTEFAMGANRDVASPTSHDAIVPTSLLMLPGVGPYIAQTFGVAPRELAEWENPDVANGQPLPGGRAQVLQAGAAYANNPQRAARLQVEWSIVRHTFGPLLNRFDQVDRAMNATVQGAVNPGIEFVSGVPGFFPTIGTPPRREIPWWAEWSEPVGLHATGVESERFQEQKDAARDTRTLGAQAKASKRATP